jgi:hypothetical protein
VNNLTIYFDTNAEIQGTVFISADKGGDIDASTKENIFKPLMLSLYSYYTEQTSTYPLKHLQFRAISLERKMYLFQYVSQNLIMQ